MKRKAALVDFNEKDDAAIALSKSMTPKERIELLFELIELSNTFRSEASAAVSTADDLPFIILKKRN